MSTNDTSTIRDLLSKNQWIDAIKVLENFPEPLPDEQLATLAWCYSRAGQYDKSIRRYDELIQRQPSIAKWHYGKGYQYYMQQHWAKAVDCFSEALALFQNYFVVKYRIAYAYVQLSGTTMQWSKDSFWKAIHHLEDCHKIYSSYSADDKRNHSATYAKVCALHGKAIMASDHYLDKAIDLLRRAREIKPDNDISYQLAKALYLKRLYSEALDLLPETDKPYYFSELRSQILSEIGKYDESNRILLRLTRFRKKDYLFRRIAENYLAMEELDEAEAFSKKSIALNNKNYKDFLILGQVLEKKRMYKSAINAFEKARLAKQNQFQIDCPEALRYIDAIIQETSNNPWDDTSSEGTENEIRHNGEISMYKRERGFGFIIDYQTTESIFFHISDYPNNDVTLGQKVEFNIMETKKGQKAVKISVL